jgi:hypothetical protein
MTIAAGFHSSTTAAGWLDAFKDPEDGQFDASKYLLERKGALPVPIIITEPAVGYGGGAALVFFQQSLSERAAQGSGRLRYRPPNMYGALGFGTENGSWGTGAGTMMSFAEDRWRLRGGGAYLDLNLDFYGIDSASGDAASEYSLSGYGGMAMVLYRLGDTNAWIAARGLYLDIESEFESGSVALYDNATRSSSGIGPSIEYDSRDNIFTPNRGWTGAFEAMFYDPAFGSDDAFQTYRARVFAYAPLPGRFILGTRLDARAASEDAPFYMVPYIVLRGIPAVRYQGERTAVLEGELRWNATPRWALMGFYGAGRAWSSEKSFSDVDSHGGGGTGFRYLVARELGVYTGLDFAWGPDFALYIQLGNAWR